MTSDDQQFLDLLASIPQDVAHYGGRLADYIEKHTNSIATEIRDAIDHASWLPESLKPVRNTSGTHFFARAPPPPKTFYEKTVTFVSNNRTAIAVVIAFASTTVYLVRRRKKEHARKRRARKQSNGAKKEIVVLACSTFHDPLTKSLAIDLERRGYVVYVTVSSTEEDSLIQQEAKADLRPLWMDLTSTVANPAVDIHPDLEPIRVLLVKSSRPSSPGSTTKSSSGSAMSNMTIAGIIVFPGCSGYPTGTLTKLHPSDVVDSINTRLLSPLLTIQQFLPLLDQHSITSDPRSAPSIIIAYPSIPQSLLPPSRIPETVITTSLSSLASSLRRELKSTRSSITVTELKLGNFDLGSVTSKSSSTPLNRSAYDHPTRDPNSTSSSQLTLTHSTHWHSSHRAAATRNTYNQSSLIRGSSAREFHNAVFDALAPPQFFKPFGAFEWTTHSHSARGGVMFVGQGARIYDFVGRWVPGGLVGALMEWRARRDEAREVRTAGENDGGRSTGSNGYGQRVRVPLNAAAMNVGGNWGFEGDGIGESGIWEKV